MPSLHEQFEQQARRTPERVAVVFQGRPTTYRQLNVRANKLARALLKRGVTRGGLVGICLHRSGDLVIAVLAVMKAGAAYLPLDPNYPQDRLSFMMDDSGVGLVIASSSPEMSFPTPHHIDSLDLSETEVMHELDCECGEELGLETEVKDPAYCIYTSGSTGRPKGVLISHCAVSNLCNWYVEEFGFVESDSFLQKYPFSFDASVSELFPPLIIGGTLVMAKPGIEKDVIGLIDSIQTGGITILAVVPTQLDALLGHPNFARCGTLRTVFSGGEKLRANLVARFHEQFDARLVNLYGPTETCVIASSFVCEPEASYVGTSIPIGKPVANTSLYVLSEDLAPVAEGEIGEICIGGIQVALGYYNRPDMTEQKFLKNPFSEDWDTPMYLTGDLGRRLPSGDIEFVGRKDDQLKLRGYRIELGEIEKRIVEYPDIDQAVADVKEYSSGEPKLIAYIVCKDKHNVETFYLRNFLQRNLPDYMIPAAFIRLAKLPLTPSGKIDRKGLASLTDSSAKIDRTFFDQEYVAPRNHVEEELARIWSDLLQVDCVGSHDNFFLLGGHSLLSVQLIVLVENNFDVRLAITDVYDFPTIAQLSGQISKLIDKKKSEHLNELEGLLDEIESMPEEEIRKLLSEES